MNLLEDALVQYDELEASFFQSLKESNLVWFGKVGGKARGDDAASILSTDRKPYKDLIKKNEISIFDFRCYLFARQAALVIRLERIADLGSRGQSLIMSLSALMRQEQVRFLCFHILNSPRLQGPESVLISSWIFSACTELATRIEDWLKRNTISEQTTIACRTYLAEFLDLARKQLEQIGMRSGHLPLAHPFIMAAREPPLHVNDHLAALHAESDEALISPAAAISQESILAASAHSSSFDALYTQYCTRAAKAYGDGRKHRLARTVRASLAAFERLRNETESAQTLYAQLSPEYSDLGWKELEARILGECKALQADLGMDKQELLTTLALVRSGMRSKGKMWTLRDDDDAELAGRLMARVGTLAQSLDRGPYPFEGQSPADVCQTLRPSLSLPSTSKIWSRLCCETPTRTACGSPASFAIGCHAFATPVMGVPF
jgi:hypothetical protein